MSKGKMLKCAFMVGMSFSKVFIGSPSYCYGFHRNATTKPYYAKNLSALEIVFDISHIANIVLFKVLFLVCTFKK